MKGKFVAHRNASNTTDPFQNQSVSVMLPNENLDEGSSSFPDVVVTFVFCSLEEANVVFVEAFSVVLLLFTIDIDEILVDVGSSVVGRE